MVEEAGTLMAIAVAIPIAFQYEICQAYIETQ
jgi:hypothetical protein